MVKNLPPNARAGGSVPGLGRSPGGGNGNPLQYSCLENPTDRESSLMGHTVHGVDQLEHTYIHLWTLENGEEKKQISIYLIRDDFPTDFIFHFFFKQAH